MTNVHIRRARAEDLDALVPLVEQLGFPVPAEELAQRLKLVLEREDHELLVVESGGKLVGWVHGLLRTMLVEGPHVFIAGLVVDAEHRNRGIGEQLMAYIEDWGRSQGAQEVHVYSNVIRERAYKFYLRIGYENHKTSKVFRKSL